MSGVVIHPTKYECVLVEILEMRPSRKPRGYMLVCSCGHLAFYATHKKFEDVTDQLQAVWTKHREDSESIKARRQYLASRRYVARRYFNIPHKNIGEWSFKRGGFGRELEYVSLAE